MIEILGLDYSNKQTSNTSNSNRARMKLMPKQTSPYYIFAPDTLTWLHKYAIGIAQSKRSNSAITYTIPLLGITNRPLPGYKKAGLNLFKTLVKIKANERAKSFDQCAIEFGPRLPINTKNFIEEFHRQIYLFPPRIKKKGRMTFYCHNSCSTAGTTDLETLRLSVLSTMPAINIDWLDPNTKWEEFWNPCAQLEPVILKLEDELMSLLDRIIDSACPSQCNAVIQRPDCFFDSIYLPYRNLNRLPALNKIVYVLPNERNDYGSIDPIDKERNLLSYVNVQLDSRISNWQERTNSQLNDDNWRLAII